MKKTSMLVKEVLLMWANYQSSMNKSYGRWFDVPTEEKIEAIVSYLEEQAGEH